MIENSLETEGIGARSLTDDELVDRARRSTPDELTEWAIRVEKVRVTRAVT